MEQLYVTFGILAVTAVIYVAMVFLLSRYLDKRDDVADVAWGSIFAVLAIISFGVHHSISDIFQPAGIVTILVIIWAARLTYSIGARFVRSKTEDRRYVEMRSGWKGTISLQSFIRIFLLQGLLALIVLLPVIVTNVMSPGVSTLMYVGIFLWFVGFVCESLADAQLKSFLKNPDSKGKLMMSGLWKYSRHPNYFGELLQWWALALIALSASYGWIGLIGPLLLSFLIIKVSGIPLAEARHADRPQWQDYKACTSMLIPLPPRRKV